MIREFSRRQFLKTGAATGAGVVALSSVARAATSANDGIVLAVMGTNGRGSALAGQFASLSDVAVSYICDVDDRAAAKGVAAVEKRGGPSPQVVKDFRRALDDKSIDALVVAAPDHWHAPATILACAAGKHVYCEKPACHNPHEGALMVEAARKHNRTVQVGTQRRSSPDIGAAIERIKGGEIGKVRFARGWINGDRPNIGRGREIPVPTELDFALWQGPAPDRPYHDNIVHYNWHWFWNWGTGELGNNGVHSLDIIRWGLGADYPTRVVCGGGKLAFDDDQQTPDTQLVTYEFGDKAAAWEHKTWHRRGMDGQGWGASFYGDDGSLVIGSSQLTFYDRMDKQLESREINRGDHEHLTNFVDCIRSGDRPNCDVEEGVKSALLCHLGNIAYRTGRTVNLDPTTGKITGDDEQIALWQREYRPGWEPTV